MQPRRAPLALLAATALAILIPAGCAKKDSVTNPKTGPTASFSALPLTGNRPLDVDFTNTSVAGTSAITSVLWSFGDGTTSAAISTGHLYGSAGTYSVSLTVTSADGSDTQTRTDYISVSNGSGPIAAFSGLPTAGNAPLTVNFTDESTPGGAAITSRSWTFGDGGTSTATNPSHTYAANGTYTVVLTVTTSLGTDDETKTDYITVSTAPVPPTAEFSGTPRDGVKPLIVQFTDQSSPGSATTITSRSWDFGDGHTSTATSPSNTYANEGTYTVSLTVTSSSGSNTNTKTGYVTVHPAPVPPTAQFSGTPTSGPAPLAVTFTDQSNAGTSPITDWAWTFGDGGTSNVASPSHTYSSPGSYNVSLRVTTADGQDTNTKNGYINPCATPAADFSATPTTVVASAPVQFTDHTVGAPTTWSWTFGDGGTSTVQNPSHAYATPGTYTVSLTSGNACGTDANTKTGYITVTDPCPNPIYTIVDAFWDTIKPAISVYHSSARLRWNADVTTGCTRMVFAKIYYRAIGATEWILKGQSSCYTITGNRTLDLGSFIVSGLALNCYEFRIALFECNGTTEVAARGPTDDADLELQCFGP